MSDLLPITIHPNDILRKQTQAIHVADITKPEMQQFIQKLKITAEIADGAGIAAPQVGVSQRIFVARLGEHKWLTCINPRILSVSLKKEIGEEGCLSIPHVFGYVMRHKKITLEYFDEQGKKRKIKATDMIARIIQHENDHLHGILFIDKLVDNIKS